MPLPVVRRARRNPQLGPHQVSPHAHVSPRTGTLAAYTSAQAGHLIHTLHAQLQPVPFAVAVVVPQVFDRYPGIELKAAASDRDGRGFLLLTDRRKRIPVLGDVDRALRSAGFVRSGKLGQTPEYRLEWRT